MHVVSRIRAACWQLEPCTTTAAEAPAADSTVVPLFPAPPPLVLVQRWIFGRVVPGNRDPRRPAPHLHPVG